MLQYIAFLLAIGVFLFALGNYAPTVEWDGIAHATGGAR